ncbi:ABC transporter ATP-binding protein [Pedobacter frigidisoli]|uniref:ABC transporter ATP-binding protein n=1 Tax=Pedobacter frigidisoli TaxID=2530455 RepID=A0A4R0P1C9_9SPHI|nr:ABC transporter ATP-binding protein [Pedobacter frigidisoli]TCD07015.1 ABC transporter ATP-binding protein [Pedobacter frigidisoli]
MLKFNSFAKSYGSHLILKIDNLTIERGVYWIKGANGSGKSTLLKSIAGFFSFKGSIFLDELNLKKDGVAYRKLVNFADAEPVYPDFLTGYEMIKLFAAAKAAERHQEEKYISEMNMQAYINNPLGTYSSGMLKKLSLVLAFLGKPKLILLDEPLNTIDVESLEVLYKWIEEKHLADNTSFFLSSHQQVDVKRILFKVALLQDNSLKIEM